MGVWGQGFGAEQKEVRPSRKERWYFNKRLQLAYYPHDECLGLTKQWDFEIKSYTNDNFNLYYQSIEQTIAKNG